MKIVKVIDRATPPFYPAMMSNDEFTVTLKFFKAARKGEPTALYYTVKLENAKIFSIRDRKVNTRESLRGPRRGPPGDRHFLPEDTWTHEIGTMATDELISGI